ncbi:radical SAM protein [Paenibacillus oenotherae]|uniref:Radical SAM protein n=1 Tax=Paenibacillus oenotherae TaxID=1435645 RepID=A0ABS7D5L6_9BACL|nr:radical SAM protein [Paenibacillus oenotherae]MBW7475237.1 radical SAM protein [Paenibacillus oenotherae]
MGEEWVRSRFNFDRKASKEMRLLYNSYSGAIAAVEGVEEATARYLLRRGAIPADASELEDDTRHLSGGAAEAAAVMELASQMYESGFLVSKHADELHMAQQLHQRRKAANFTHLVILPTEDCNLRCTYCYQSFLRGEMGRGTIEGLKAYVHRAAGGIEHLAVSWFGGEPLHAADVLTELSQAFKMSCASANIRYSADMSTNGYELTKERLIQLLDLNVHRYMVTLDGVGAVHDRRRGLREHSGGTFERIIGNLLELREIDRSFTIDIRVNFDKENVGEIPKLLDLLAEAFGGDPRFQLLVRPVGRWGGPHNERIPVCGRTAADAHLWELTRYGLERGLVLSESISDSLKPSGSVCYAAMPQSLVVGSDGRLYKCTLALDDEMNQVGRLHDDGSIELDTDKLALWTDSGEEQDAVCRTCFYRPSCQGNHCPLYRMRTGRRPCPHEKRRLGQVLDLLWRKGMRGE